MLNVGMVDLVGRADAPTDVGGGGVIVTSGRSFWAASEKTGTV